MENLKSNPNNSNNTSPKKDKSSGSLQLQDKYYKPGTFENDVHEMIDSHTCSLKEDIIIKIILQGFCQCSALILNFAKSSLFPIRPSNHSVHSIAELFGCKIGRYPIWYFGLPLSPYCLNKRDFIPLIDKLRRDGWKRKLLSRGGHLMLINSILIFIPLYIMSLFQLPKWAIKKNEEIRNAFLWWGTNNVHTGTNNVSHVNAFIGDHPMTLLFKKKKRKGM